VASSHGGQISLAPSLKQHKKSIAGPIPNNINKEDQMAYMNKLQQKSGDYQKKKA